MKHLTISFREGLGNLPGDHWIAIEILFGADEGVLRIPECSQRHWDEGKG